jgi:hypothetical protein
MPRKERYPKFIKCPICKREDKAEFEENENPVHRRGDLDTTLVFIPDGFTAEKNNKGDFTFRCTRCNVLAV